MRTFGWWLLGCLVCACGGNFSNDDLEFLNALPERQDLSSKLPGGDTAAQLLRPHSLSSALAVGDASQLYVDTHQASTNFNSGLDSLLTLLESIRALPPTTRATDLRVWGPVADKDHPGHEVRFVMKRDGARFDYTLQYRPAHTGEDAWWSLLEGTFQASGGLRQGEGSLRLLLSAVRAHGFDAGSLAGLDLLDIGYQTRVQPIQVQMRFVPSAASGGSELLYSYRELSEGLGEMAFLLHDTDVIPGGKLEDLSIVSRWTREHGGVGVVAVTGGDVPEGYTANQVECWDATFRVTYSKRSWDFFVVGSPSGCPDVSALGP